MPRDPLALDATRRICLNPATIDPRWIEAAQPEAQAELVSEALHHLEAVRLLVSSLDEVPGGDRGTMLSELSRTADSLRQLFFLDAIY